MLRRLLAIALLPVLVSPASAGTHEPILNYQQLQSVPATTTQAGAQPLPPAVGTTSAPALVKRAGAGSTDAAAVSGTDYMAGASIVPIKTTTTNGVTTYSAAPTCGQSGWMINSNGLQGATLNVSLPNCGQGYGLSLVAQGGSPIAVAPVSGGAIIVKGKYQTGVTSFAAEGQVVALVENGSNYASAVGPFPTSSQADPWMDVRDPAYAGGAKGDQTTDDAAAIQATVTAAAAAGAAVLIPPGNYCIKSQPIPVSFTGSVGNTAGTAAGNVLGVSAITSGRIVVGGTLAGSGIAAGTVILGQASGTPGGAGSYVIGSAAGAAQASANASQNVASEAMSETNLGVVVAAPVKIIGSMLTQIQACGSQVTPLTIDAAYSAVDGLVIAGPKFQSGNALPLGNGLVIGQNAVGTSIVNVRTQWGLHPFYAATSDYRTDNVTSQEAYGSAVAYIGNPAGGASGYLDRNKTDTSWPQVLPVNGYVIGKYAANTAYKLGDVVYAFGYVLQATVAGTTSAGLAKIPDFETDQPDGTVTWRLGAPQNQYGLQIDTGSNSLYASLGDYTGPYRYGVGLTNTLIPSGQTAPIAAFAPQGVQLFAPTSGAINVGVDAGAGNALTVIGGIMGHMIDPTAIAGVYTHDAFSGELVVSDMTLFQARYGVLCGAGTKCSVRGGAIAGMNVAAVYASVSQFIVQGVDASTSAAWGANACGVKVPPTDTNNATIDHGLIVGNNLYGATGCDPSGISQASSGTHIVVTANTN